MNNSQPPKPWWTKPTTILDISFVLTVLMIITFMVIDLLNLRSTKWFDDNLGHITLLLISIVIISNIIERYWLIESNHAQVISEVRKIQIGPYDGLTKFYANRALLPSFPVEYKDVSQELFIIGIELHHIIFQQIGFIRQLAEDGVRVKIIMVDPGSETSPNPLISRLEQTLSLPTLEQILRTNINLITDKLSKMPNQTQKNIEVRVSSFFPTEIVVFADPDRYIGRMRIELLPPNFEPSQRPSFEISASRGGELFRNYLEKYRDLWDKATPINKISV